MTVGCDVQKKGDMIKVHSSTSLASSRAATPSASSPSVRQAEATTSTASNDAGDKPIPIPGCRFTTAVLPPMKWKRPREYVKYKPRSREQIDSNVLYEIEYDDETWLREYNETEPSKITKEEFEVIVDRLEKDSVRSGKYATVDQVKEKILSALPSSSLGNIINVYNYWVEKRKARRQSLIRDFWRPPTHNNRDVQHVAFRPRTAEKIAPLRRDKNAEIKLYERLKRIRDDLVQAKSLCEKTLKREKLKQTRVSTIFRLLQLHGTANPKIDIATTSDKTGVANSMKTRFPWERQVPTERDIRSLLDAIVLAKKRCATKESQGTILPDIPNYKIVPVHPSHNFKPSVKQEAGGTSSRVGVASAGRGYVAQGNNGRSVGNGAGTHGARAHVAVNGGRPTAGAYVSNTQGHVRGVASVPGGGSVGKSAVGTVSSTNGMAHNGMVSTAVRPIQKKRPGEVVVQTPSKRPRPAASPTSSRPPVAVGGPEAST